MSYGIIDSLVLLFFSLIGNGILMAIFINFMVVLFLAAMKINNPAIYFVIMAPMNIGLIINSKFTNAIEVPPWIAFVILITIGILFAIAFIKIITDQ